MANFLKKLELSGFKSFANRTTLEFQEGITAIVGPNGSGKSNIVDAIRWLLGEREAKNLRGAKVEDLIFAGTAKRPRVGQAQASLHFENATRFFPVESAEVAVMREVRRDGASRYFLNKSEARLKDLVDFFAKARLGSKGLTVIGQGQSDIFIQASPPARREMIEEMLGLREYQIKKISAENRLEASETNLEKVKALIEEILPHMRSLKRQAGRWEKRGALEAELRELETVFFGSQLAALGEELRSVDASIEAHRKEFEALEEERRVAENHQRTVEASQPEKRKELLGVKRRVQTLLDERSVLQKELGRIEAQIELGAPHQDDAPASQEKLFELVKRIRAELSDAAGKDFVELEYIIKDIVEDIDGVLEDMEREEGRGQAAPPDLKEHLERTQKNLAAAAKQISDLKADEERLEKRQDAFYEDFKSAVAAVRGASAKIESWESENQKRRLEKQRIELRRDEVLRQAVQAGRTGEEFKDFRPADGARDLLSDLDGLERRILKLRVDLASMGEVDEALVKEARDTESRHQFLSREAVDLEKAKADLYQLIADLSEKIRREFGESLGKINEEFNNFFRIMFGGGQAKLKLKKEEKRESTVPGGEIPPGGGEDEAGNSGREKTELSEEGLEIDIKLPRKHAGSLEMLSGGERSLVGIAALFAMISVSPPPFLVLDEVDAALDDQNARRFAEILKVFSQKTQFIVVTHNRATMEAANILYGVTLHEDGTSKILSLKLEGAVA